jgi:hypothetical protein
VRVARRAVRAEGGNRGGERGSLAERCEQRGATVAETSASLKGAQRELGDVWRTVEAATLEAERTLVSISFSMLSVAASVFEMSAMRRSG